MAPLLLQGVYAMRDITTAQANAATGSPRPTPEASGIDEAQLLADLIQIGIALSSERDLGRLLERIVAEARRFTRAEAGTLFLREGDALRFTVVQNDPMVQRFGEIEAKRRISDEPLTLGRRSLAGFVAETGQVINLDDAYDVPTGSPFAFNWRFDARTNYRTRSVLVVPLQDPNDHVIGVLQLMNAADRNGNPIAFDEGFESLVRSLASQAAVAIRNARLEELSFKDSLTDVYNRRYFRLRLEEEAKRHSRFEQPLSLVIVDVDHFKEINDRAGHGTGDQVLREISQLLVNQSRSFTTVTRYGGDEFAILLVNTPKTGAVTYAQRMKGVIERYPFAHGPVTVSIGVAGLPDDATTGDALVTAADRGLYEAKRTGRNAVGVA
jgi:diguanylate cyclase (GGDEF)-like protein